MSPVLVPVSSPGQGFVPRILLVDDNDALLDNLNEILGANGFRVTTASNADDALAAAMQGFEVALVDLRLPDARGEALTWRLKELAPNSAIVLLTGHATLDSAIAAVRTGAFAYLVKPCSTPELLLTVDQALRHVQLTSERLEFSRRAQVAEKLAAVGTLTAGLSHEIRNPLNAASLQLTVLERRVKKLGIAQQHGLLEPLTLVRDEIQRLGRLLDDFLRFARPRDLKVRRTDVPTLVAKVRALLDGDAEVRGVSLLAEVSGQCSIAADEEQLQQVLVNLVLNALEATRKDGRVRLGAVATNAGEVLISIDDDGPGISPEVRARIFEPFFTTKAAGTGLGLAIVHAIVTQHGGTIAVERSPLGGARFAVRLPRNG
jgi:signal transduction histidine kinase